MQFGMIVSMIFAVLAVIFAVQNTEIVTLHFFIWSFSLPLAILMILALAIGAVFAAVFTLPGWFRWKRSDRVYKKELTGLEDSLSKYRADLIDTQNKNKDLRQKIFELEEAKDQLEATAMRRSGADISASECGTCRVQMRHGRKLKGRQIGRASCRERV